MTGDGRMGGTGWMDAAGAAMWALVERHTGRVGYRAGSKASGLAEDPPVIDCSGWTAVLLSAGMAAANGEAGRALFSDADVAAIHTWSDRIVANVERRSGLILTAERITAAGLPAYATIGLQQGGGAWATNHPRPRGITHIVQVVRRPTDGAPYVSEAQGMTPPYGLRLRPLAQWIDETQDLLTAGRAWAVAPFGA